MIHVRRKKNYLLTPQQTVTAHHPTLRGLLYLINSLTLDSTLWTLGPPCVAVLSRSWTPRCLSGVKVKERYAPERSALVRMAFFRTREGEEVGKTSSWLLCGSSEGFRFFCRGGKRKCLNVTILIVIGIFPPIRVIQKPPYSLFV